MSIFLFYNYEEKSITQASNDIEIVEQVNLWKWFNIGGLILK